MTKLYFKDQLMGLKLFVPNKYIFEVACIKGSFRMVFFRQERDCKIKPPKDYKKWEKFDLDERVETAITNRAYLSACSKPAIGFPVSELEASELINMIKNTLEMYR
ncbi:hypothetical protein HZA97_00355 [Candidatus Woesearchaeota archaeon]|nr:hypothetical protein [Candidatus Woesearchaeota archaeon]